MTITPPSSALGRELQALTQQGVLSSDQATQLWRAAEQDRGEPAGAVAPTATGGPSRTGVVDVLGYLGGALLLGAVIFVGSTLWSDLGRGGRIAVAAASFGVPLAGGLVLERIRRRRGLARMLLVVACVATGFVTVTILDDRELLISSGVVVAAALVGATTVRSAAFYGPGWVAAMIFTQQLVVDVLPLTAPGSTAYATAAGFLVVGVVLVGCGLVLRRQVAWTLAGISGWAAAATLTAFDRYAIAVVVATVVAAALFVGVVRLQLYAFAVVGCLIVLSIWPWALYQILDSAVGVAVGLVAAGSVLIGSAVLFARRRRRDGADGDRLRSGSAAA